MKMVLLAALAVAPALHAQTQWKLATGYRVESFHTRNIVQFAQDVERASSGALRIEVHANNTLARLADIPAAVQGGKAQAGETIMTSLVADMPIAGADAVPFVVHSYADARRLWDLQRPLIDTHLAAKGIKALYAVPWPPQGLLSVAPVRSSADFKGTRMRTYNPATVRIAQMLGATPVDVPMVDVNKALSAGKLDSMITSALTGVENQVWGQIRQYYGINAWFPKNIVFVNQQAFDALPASVREAVVQAAAQAEARGWALSAAVAEESVAELQRRGIKVDRAPAELDSELRRLGERFSREWVQSVGNEANKIFIPYYFQR
ncbi:TRAP transporter substrate-binding protein [Acidovorax sp. sif1233]|uniref:TRAP transporter substrate-binding protein n=1 Tax=unclassified Acidovorax TaxID=2684926 RepID=UPI001C46D630|nr:MULTISPECIES: TRAP transporter substrate-binding protein [unclassified Acidovorax]MBV7426912.1 TRAP transporter substrate-binding protein [Acidovorax sp. sif0732]MBV7448037.1 TRAP transporter substrate-binding protein [Acidovorax sp. sif0715]MBV7455073.1 TRAP transporter substrate-binding protein [Acidovorax sp. sif1233]